MSGPRVELIAPHDEPVLVGGGYLFVYAAAGAERGLAQCHERLDELLTPLAPLPREGQKP